MMLQEATISNFAIIDSLRITFRQGLTVITGETGAGKSILIEAALSALGERTSPEAVRLGCSRAAIDLLFTIDDSPELELILESLGIECDPDDGELVCSREIYSAGRSQARINARPVALSAVRQVAAHLVQCSGSEDFAGNFVGVRQRDLLDAWGGKPLQTVLAEFRKYYAALQTIREESSRLQDDSRRARELTEELSVQIAEIRAVNPQPNEDAELAADRNRLSHAQKLTDKVAAALNILEGDDLGGLLEGLRRACALLNEAARTDQSLVPTALDLEQQLYALVESSRAMRRYLDSLDRNPQRLQHIIDRLDAIARLKRKYGDTIEDILAAAMEAEERLGDIADAETRLEMLASQERKLLEDVERAAHKLSAARQSAGEDLARRLTEECRDLGFAALNLQVVVKPAGLTSSGSDGVEILVSLNPGESPKPVAEIASLGESSRLLLGLKCATAKLDRTQTIIFDELDVGIGGITAQRVGEKLKQLSRGRQVIVITHLPQIAELADHHISVRKIVAGDRTKVEARELRGNERAEELRRMRGLIPV